MDKINYRQSRKSVFCRLPLGNITASGWLKQQLEIEAAGMGGHLDELEPKMIYDPFVSRHHENKLGEAYDASLTVGWSAEISGTYWNGLVLLAFALDSENLKDKAKQWVDKVLAGQEEDGYIGGYGKNDNRMEDYNAWSQNWAMRALLAYYEATGRQDVLEACHQGLLWFVRNWSNHFTDYAGSTLIESMVEVYLYTGDKKLIEWSEKYLQWLERNSKQKNKMSDFASDLSPYHTIHAVAYGEEVKHTALLYKCNGREDYLRISIKGLKKVIDKCLQRTGAPSTNVEFLSPVGDVCETEYCDFETFERTFLEMGVITGNPNYFDLAEKIVFNGSQGAKKKDGRAIAYMSSPNQFVALRNSSVYSDDADSEVYSSCFRVACCPTHAVLVIPEYVKNMCMVDNAGVLYFNCYGPCTVKFINANGDNITIDEITEYPFREDIKLVIHTDNSSYMKLMLRVPEWCKGAEYSINGTKSSSAKCQAGYFEIERAWKDGDVIDLHLPMEVKAVDVDDSDFCMRFPVAIERGPLLFAYHLPEKWTVTAPVELNPHPDWPCYEINTEISEYYPKGLVLDRKSLESSSAFKVAYRDIGNENPWVKSPVVITLTAGQAEYIYNRRMITTQEQLPMNIVKITGESKEIELVPYGCTNLRISYFPAYNR
ncbi:MAG: beta-L-arabinofuranosidase domain-containing protein [Sedimentisphaerales bacterium]